MFEDTWARTHAVLSLVAMLSRPSNTPCIKTTKLSKGQREKRMLFRNVTFTTPIHPLFYLADGATSSDDLPR